MKTKILLGLAALALSTGAFAAPMESATTTLSHSVRLCANTDDEPCQPHSTNMLETSYQWGIGEHWAIQADLGYERHAGMADGDEQAKSAGAAALHLSWRNASWLVGGFYGSQQFGSDGDNDDGFVYGGEFQWYSDAITYYAIVGYSDITYDNGDNSFRGMFWSGEARYFIADDTRLSGSVAYGRSPYGYEDSGDSGDAYTLGVSLTRRWGERDLWWSVSYEHGSYIANTEDAGSEQRFTFGLTWLFGADSLKQLDRDGATLRTSLLPGRAASWAQVLD